MLTGKFIEDPQLHEDVVGGAGAGPGAGVAGAAELALEFVLAGVGVTSGLVSLEVPIYTSTKLKAIINIGRTKIPHATKLAPFIDKYIIPKIEMSPKKAWVGILADSFTIASCIIIAVNNAPVAIAG